VPNTDYNQYVSRKKAFVETKNFSMAGRELAKLKELRKMSDENVQPVDVGEVPTPGETIETPSVEAGGSFVDDYAVDVPDIPIPDDEPEGNSIEDEFEGAYKFAVVGVGQGGSRIAQTFWNLGYRRVAIINTAKQDLDPIDMPTENKLLIGGDGAGKKPEIAEEIFNAHREDILDFLKRTFGDEFDRVLVCAGAGGGTGAGGCSVVIEVAHDLCESLGVETRGEGSVAKVGAIVALPSKAEGNRVASNTKRTMDKVLNLKNLGALTPLVILDNEKIKQIYPKLPVRKFWGTSNSSVCALFHLFNRISAQESVYTSFDKADLETVFASGLITFGATPLKKWDQPTDVSQAIRDNLKRTILANLDPSTGNIASCVVIGSTEVLDELPQENLEYGFEQLTRILGSGSTVHRGVYSGSKPGMIVYTAIGGLDAPKEFLD
tara:strand:+ start:25 stop:1329 length:1305 start_codon:yes stop_codon:yes gene_type:complete